MIMRILWISIFLVATSAFATPQIPDVIVMDSIRYALIDYPLEHFFHDFPEKRPESSRFFSTALYRGYRATFIVSNDSVFLSDTYWYTERDSINLLPIVFSDPSLPFCSWMNLYLAVCIGDLEYRTCPSYLLLTIKHGIITVQKDISHDEYEDFLNERVIEYCKTHPEECQKEKEGMERELKELEKRLKELDE